MKSMYVGIAVFVCGFAAGAAMNGWRLNAKIAKQETAQVALQRDDAVNAFNNVNSKLKDVILKVDSAATKATNINTQLGTLSTATNTQLGVIASNTQKVSDEINALGVPQCVFGANVGELYFKASQAANSGRSALYGSGR
jgi:hypothetical protein